MITTRQQLRDQKRQTFHVKEDNPDRKHMTQENAIKDNQRLKDGQEKLDVYARKLKRERDEAAEEDKVSMEISGLEAQLKVEGIDPALKASIEGQIKVLKDGQKPKKKANDKVPNTSAGPGAAERANTETDKEKQSRIDAENTKITIDGLEAEFDKQKGPGSKARKDELREKINALKS